MGENSLAEQLADIQHPGDVGLSPSGSQIIYSLMSLTQKDEHATCSIWLAQFGVKHSARQLSSGLYNDQSPRWSPDEKHIAFISDRAERGKSSAIYILSLSGGEAYPITESKNEKPISSLAWSPDGKYIAYLSADEKTPEQKKKEEDKLDARVYGEEWEYNRLRCVHVATKKVSTLFKKDAHVTRLAWCTDLATLQLGFVTQRTPELDIAFDEGIHIQTTSVTGQSQLVCHFPDPIADFVICGKSLVWNARRTPESSPSFCSIYTTSIESGQAFSGPFYGQNDSVNSLKSDGSIYLQLQASLSDQLIDFNSREVLYEEECMLESWDVASVVNGKKIVFVKGDSSHPPEVFSYDGGDLIQLSQHGESLLKADFGTAKPFTCTAEDGSEIDGILTIPGDSSQMKPYPTLVLIHGGPYDRVSISFGMPFGYFKWAPYFVAAGYAVLCPNYRGGSSRGDKYAGATHHKLGTLDYSDIIALTQAGIKQGIFDEKRVGVGGWSQGGFLSYLAVTRPETFQFKAAVCGAGVTDWDMMTMSSDVPIIEARLAGIPSWETDSKDVRMRNASPLWHMKGVDDKMRTPLLLLHGEEDERVPLAQSQGFHRGCKSLGWDCTFVTYPREGHIIMERGHVVDMLERMRRFYDLHLR